MIVVRGGCLVMHHTSQLEMWWYQCISRILLRHHWSSALTFLVSTLDRAQLTTIIQKRRLTLFGHLVRMDESADARRILTAVPQSEWRRPVGRPYTSWMATLKNDLARHNLTCCCRMLSNWLWISRCGDYWQHAELRTDGACQIMMNDVLNMHHFARFVMIVERGFEWLLCLSVFVTRSAYKQWI